MWWTLLTAVVVPTTGCLAWHRWNRVRLYRRLASERNFLISRQHVGFDFASPAESVHDAFAREPIVRIDRVLSEETRQAALAECEKPPLSHRAELCPRPQEGGNDLLRAGPPAPPPICLSIYHSPILLKSLSELIGSEVRLDRGPRPELLLGPDVHGAGGTTSAGTSDHNFYRGRHFTVLIPLINRSAAGEGDLAEPPQAAASGGNEDAVFSTAANSAKAT